MNHLPWLLRRQFLAGSCVVDVGTVGGAVERRGLGSEVLEGLRVELLLLPFPRCSVMDSGWWVELGMDKLARMTWSAALSFTSRSMKCRNMDRALPRWVR